MLKMFRSVTVPDSFWMDIFAQIIDMPMFDFYLAEMTGDTRPHTARPERASDIDIASWLQSKFPPAAYLDGFGRNRFENECIRSGI